jgi:GNAT superfamily N-acetyltransferase
VCAEKSDPISIGLLADFPELIPQVGQIRRAEWGTPPEPTDLDFWVEVTRKEAGRDEMPITWVAVNEQRRAIGAVGIDDFDPNEFRDRSPWLVGMVVAPDWRGQGVGKRLVRQLEIWAAGESISRVWVATGPPGGPAELFYRSCAWETVDGFRTSTGEDAVILERRLDRTGR